MILREDLMKQGHNEVITGERQGVPPVFFLCRNFEMLHIAEDVVYINSWQLGVDANLQ